MYTLHADSTDVAIVQWETGRDMSDHYGIQASIDTTVQLFPSEVEVRTLEISLAGFRCLQTTSGPGDDEVSFMLTAKSAGGRTVSLSSPQIEDVSAGTQYDFAVAPMRVPDLGDELSLSITGNEIDDLSADDLLGRTRLVFDRQEFLALMARGHASLAFPVLRGDGGEYVVEADLRLP